jgi:hypothetical protein
LPSEFKEGGLEFIRMDDDEGLLGITPRGIGGGAGGVRETG